MEWEECYFHVMQLSPKFCYVGVLGHFSDSMVQIERGAFGDVVIARSY